MRTPDAVNSLSSVAVRGTFERISGPKAVTITASQQSLSLSSKLVGGGFGAAVGLMGGTLFGALRGAALGLTGKQSLDARSFKITEEDEAFLKQCINEGREVSWQVVNGKGRAVVEFPAGDFILQARRQVGPLLAGLVGMAAGASGCAIEFARNGAQRGAKVVERRISG